MNATQNPPYDAPSRHRPAALPGVVGSIASRAFGALLLLAVVYFTYELPFARAYVAAALLLCFVAECCLAGAWLFYVPALLPVFDLTLWSGRLFVNEFDLLIVTTAAAHFLRAPPGHRFPSLRNGGGAIIALLIVSYLASLWIGAWPLAQPDANQLGSYLSHYNALRVAKSFAWALLLLGALQSRLSADAVKAATSFVIGTAVGLILVGLVVMWERGVFLAIVQSPGLYAARYAIAGALLDFTSLYRATALFSELHTGGEAIDTYMSLAPPIAAGGVLLLHRPLPRLICLAGLAFGTYAAVATFSRGLYAAYACGLLTVVVLAFIGQRQVILHGRFAVLRATLAVVIGLFVLVVAYTYGGYNGLVFAMGLSGAGIAAAHFLGVRALSTAALALVAVALIGVYAFWHAFAFARYSTMGSAAALSWAFACGVGVVVGAALLGGRLIPPERRVGAAIALALLAMVSGIIIPATGGYRMIERFSTVNDDSKTRWDHWRDALLLMGPDVTDYAFGMGLGSFPRLYFRHGVGPEMNGSYRYGRDATRSWITLGAGGFNMTQRVPVRPDTKYAVSYLARTTDAHAQLNVALCSRWILISERDAAPDCKVTYVRPPATGEWTATQVPLDSGQLGQYVPFSWPTILVLHNDSEQATIDVTDVHLTANGQDIVANGDFSAGGDRWLEISDFEHLAWHVKNLYVAVFFEMGAIGLAIFLLLLIMATSSAVRTHRQRAPIGIGLAGALVAFVVDGFVGSLLDNPRPAFLFFVILLWALQAAPMIRRDARHIA